MRRLGKVDTLAYGHAPSSSAAKVAQRIAAA